MKTDSFGHIIFVQWTRELPEYYIRLSAIFRAWGLTLVPIRYDQLSRYHFDRQQNIISLTPDMQTQKRKLQAMKYFLNFAIKSGHFNFYDVTSFSHSDFADSSAFLKNYQMIKLPMKYIDLAKTIAHDIDERAEEKTHWPGGRRSKLPRTQSTGVLQ